MVRAKVVPEKMREEPRLDSGAVLSDSAALSDGPGPNGKLTMPTLRNTNWNYGAPKARYRKNELQLRQPKGFPIKPLKITLDRAREEAEFEAAAKRYADPNFKNYEDLEEDDYDSKVETEDEETEEIAEGFAYDSADGSADGSDTSAEPSISKVVAEKSAALIDSRGRTRAATARRKAQEASESAMPSTVSREDEKYATMGNKKRKHGGTQAGKQPRNTLPKKSV